VAKSAAIISKVRIGAINEKIGCQKNTTTNVSTTAIPRIGGINGLVEAYPIHVTFVIHDSYKPKSTPQRYKWLNVVLLVLIANVRKNRICAQYSGNVTNRLHMSRNHRSEDPEHTSAKNIDRIPRSTI